MRSAHQRFVPPAFLLLIGGLLAVATGCGRPPEGETAAPARRLSAVSGTVSVIVNLPLSTPLEAAVASFRAAHPSVTVDLEVTPSPQLADVVNTAGKEAVVVTMGPQELVPCDQAQRLAPGSRVILADIPLVLIVARGNPLGIASLDALAGKGGATVLLAQGGTIGKEAEAALRAAGVWEKLGKRVKRAPLIDIARQVSEGKVAAGIVGGIEARAEGVEAVLTIDPALYGEAQAVAVRTVGLELSGAVKAFVEFLDSPQGRMPFLDAGLREHVEPAASDASLFMYAGAAFRPVIADLVKAFTAQTGIEIRPTYMGSGCLLAQITIGQSGDLYMPGEDWYMEQAQERGYVSEYRIIGYFVPVIMVHEGNPKGVRGLEDLLRPGMRLGMGEPKATAIGDFTPRVLAANGISMEQFGKNVVAHFGTAPELGNSVVIGSVDAAIQWDAVAAYYEKSADVIAFPVDEKTVSPIPLGVLKFSKHPAEAKQFLEFVSGPQGQAILKARHYTLDWRSPTYPAQGASGP